MGPWGIALAILIGASFTEGGRNGMRKAAKEGFKSRIFAERKRSGLFQRDQRKSVLMS